MPAGRRWTSMPQIGSEHTRPQQARPTNPFGPAKRVCPMVGLGKVSKALDQFHRSSQSILMLQLGSKVGCTASHLWVGYGILNGLAEALGGEFAIRHSLRGYAEVGRSGRPEELIQHEGHDDGRHPGSKAESRRSRSAVVNYGGHAREEPAIRDFIYGEDVCTPPRRPEIGAEGVITILVSGLTE